MELRLNLKIWVDEARFAIFNATEPRTEHECADAGLHTLGALRDYGCLRSEISWRKHEAQQ